MGFQLNSQQLFLTYPKCDIHPLYASILLTEIFDTTKYLIAQEQHQDGTFHLHAYLRLTKAIRTRDQFFADITDHDGKTYHGNYRGARSPKSVLQYCTKGNTWETNIPNFEIPAKPLRQIIDQSQTASEFIQQVKINLPRDWILYPDRYTAYAKSQWYEPPERYRSPYQLTDFSIPGIVRTWMDEVQERSTSTVWIRTRGLVLHGPSRTGKTSLARSIGPHIYWNHMINLDDWFESADYIILDDIDWDYVPAKKCFFGCQECFVLTDKYKKKQTVKGKPVIYICNDLPSALEEEWYKKNTYKVNIINNLFS